MSIELCGEAGCRRVRAHSGRHDRFPAEAWDFCHERDKKKIAKAGFATPRGGAKGAYQNHVVRSCKVILPYERLSGIKLDLYRDGYVIRLLPEQFFKRAGCPKAEFSGSKARVKVGVNAFVLYRTHDVFYRLPPLKGWKIRSLLLDGKTVDERRGEVQDVGHYVLRIQRHGAHPKRFAGPPQGVFAPEYADEETNFLCKCVLVWLLIQTRESPYTLTQAAHLRAILAHEELDNADIYERRGVVRRGLASCPLCMRFLTYRELHDTISFEAASGLINAGEQVQGATRSTVVNLFHLMPLLYNELTHIPQNVGWGHAVCNTRLGQRPCYSLQELQEKDRKVGIVRPEGIETFGWISEDWLMIRSPNGAVWIQLNGDIETGPPEESVVFDAPSQIDRESAEPEDNGS